MPDNESIDLARRWREGDEGAADALFSRYAGPLIGLVRKNLSEKLAGRLDPEDVVQSAYRSFFVGVRDGRILLEQSGELWRLLVVIAIHKLRHQVGRHTAAKRTVDREARGESIHHLLPAAWIESPPTPADALILSEQIEHLMAPLTEQERRIFELRLEAYTLEEIATATRRSQRTVRRVLDRIKRMARRQFDESLVS